MTSLLFVTIARPNALDREVSALSAYALLHLAPARLIDQARAAAAMRLEQFDVLTWIVMMALQIAALAWFWSSGLSGRLRDRLRALVRPEFGVRFCFGALLALLDKLAALVPQALEYRYARIMDLNSLLLRTWLTHWVASTLVAMIVAGVIAAVILWLADRTHQWYLYTIVGVIGCTLLVTYASPFVIAPAYASFTPLPVRSSLGRDLAALEQHTGVAVPLLEEHLARRTHVGKSYVIGWGGSQRIVISDTMRAGATQPELRFLLARSLAWIVANSGLHVALVQGAFLVLGTALAVFISDRIGFRRDDDPVSRLALFGAILGGVYLLALPFYNGYARQLAASTDAAAVALTGDPVAAIRMEVRNTDQALQPICPSAFAQWYFDQAPSAGQRIAAFQGRPDYCATARGR